MCPIHLSVSFCSNAYAHALLCGLPFGRHVCIFAFCSILAGLFNVNFFGTAECQQIHYPLSELPRAEIEKEREMRDGSVDGWMDGRTSVSCDTLPLTVAFCPS